MEAAHHRERGKVRQLLRDFDGARQGRKRNMRVNLLYNCARPSRWVPLDDGVDKTCSIQYFSDAAKQWQHVVAGFQSSTKILRVVDCSHATEKSHV